MITHFDTSSNCCRLSYWRREEWTDRIDCLNSVDIFFWVSDRMYSVVNTPEPCSDCEEYENRDGWFVCQGQYFDLRLDSRKVNRPESFSLECSRLFCSRHSIAHRHPSLGERITGERYNRHAHLDRIAEWERKAIERIRKQADDARRPLLAPPTPFTETPPLTAVNNELSYSPLVQLLTGSSNTRKQVCPFSSPLSPSLDSLGRISAC